MTVRNTFALVDCEDATQWKGYSQLWIAALGREGDNWSHFKAYDGELPKFEDLDNFCGLIITNSHHDARSEAGWIVDLVSYVKNVVQNHSYIKILGCGFGGQVLARALGGKLGAQQEAAAGTPGAASSPSSSWGWGVESEVQVTPSAARSRAEITFALGRLPQGQHQHRHTFRALTPPLPAQVEELPPGADVLATLPRNGKVVMWALGREGEGSEPSRGNQARLLAVQGTVELTRALALSHLVPGLVEAGQLTQDQASQFAEYAASDEAPALQHPFFLDLMTFFLRSGFVPVGGPPQEALQAVESTFGPQALPFQEVWAASLGGEVERMLSAVTAAVEGEMTATSNEYLLLANMNNLAGEKYREMGDFAEAMAAFVERMKQKEESFQPYLEQIDGIENQVSELEQVVTKLDDYTRQMEAQFKRLIQSPTVT